MKYFLYNSLILAVLLGLKFQSIGQIRLNPTASFEPLEMDAVDIYNEVRNFNFSVNSSSMRMQNMHYKMDSSHYWTSYDNVIPSSKVGITHYHYDTLQNIDILTYSSLDFASEKYIPRSYLKFIYDDRDRLIRQSTHIWDGTIGPWDDDLQSVLRIYEYNNFGLIVSLREFDNNISTDSIPLNMTEYKYDSEQNLIIRNNYSKYPSEDTLTKTEIQQYFYDGGLMTSVESSMNHPSRGWTPVDSSHLQYDTDENLVHRKLFIWNGTTFYHSKDYQFEYNSEGLLKRTSYKWAPDLNTGNFTIWDEIEYRYEVDNLIGVFTYSLDENGDILWLSQKEIIDYNFDVPISDILMNRNLLEFIDFQFKNMIKSSEASKIDVASPYRLAKTDYFYSQLSTSTKGELTPNGSEISLFPNPASQKISLKGLSSKANIQIYSTEGLRILNTELHPKEQISISHLNSGLYYLIISNKDSQRSLKFVTE